MPNTKVYNPETNTTGVWDDRGFLGHETGDTTKGANTGSSVTKGPGNTSQIDIPEFSRRLAGDVLPAAINIATEGLGGPALRTLGPLKGVLAKMGLSTLAGTATDQALNVGNEKPVLDSGIQALINSGLGIGIPEMANVGIRVPGMTRRTDIMRQNGGVSRTSTDSTTLNKIIEELPPYVPGKGPQGQVLFGKKPQPIPVNQTISRSNTEGSNSGSGHTGIVREVGLPGAMGHILEMLKNLESFKYSGLQGRGAGNLSPLMTALAGLGFNLGPDVSSPPKK